jgi:CRP-like cAMP-binding protein
VKQEFIQFAPLFTGFTEEEQALLIENFASAQAAAGSPLFKTGDQADGLYLIGKGFVRLMTPSGISLATLGPGSVLGEDSLFRNLPYDISAQAVAELEYWKLADRNLRQMIVQQPAMGLKLSHNFGSLIAQMQDYLVQRLAQTAELSSLPRHTLQAVADQLQPRRLAQGQYLFRAGDSPSGLFLVEFGSIDVQPDGSDERQVVRVGELLGAMALITNKAHTSNAVAADETILWALSTDDFQAINSRQPGLRRSLGRNVRSRLSRNDQSAAAQRLHQMPIFAELPPQAMQAIVGRMVLQHVPAGERVYRIGEAGDALFLIENGEIELTAENAVGVVEEIGRIGPESHFGELSLLTGQIRTEDATATRNSNLWVLYKSDLDALSTQYPAVGKALSQGVATRLASNGGAEDARLQQFSLFAGMIPSDLHQIAAHLRPMRYRTGEQIFRAGSPPEGLFLVEKGTVGVQALGGAAWQAGPGESFGERALLTNQPHNTSAVAETDVDLWTMTKADFDMLMNRFPALAISMSRILSQRLSQVSTIPSAPPGAAGVGQGQYVSASAVAQPGAPNQAQRRRQQAAAAPETEGPARRRGFGGWYSNLSGFGKLSFALLVLLLILFLCITIPFTVFTLLNGPEAAIRAATATLDRAASFVLAPGSFRLAADDRNSIEQMRLADSLIPATPTYTPFPTATPPPTATPLPTNTPTPAPTDEPVEFLAADAFLGAAEAAPVDTPAPEGPQPTPVPARNLDPRLAQLGIAIDDAPAGPGQQYWRLIEARWEDEQQAGGKHHIYVDVLDENGNRLVGQPVTVWWGDGNYTAPLEDKPAPDLGFNYQMYASGYAYNVKVEGLPSDVARGAGMGDLANRFKGIHTAYYFVFQRATK